MTQELFNTIIQLCADYNGQPEEALEAVALYLQFRQYGETIAQHPEQTTHTASVHESVSASATALMTRYRTLLAERTLPVVLYEFSTWLLEHANTSPENLAAYHCIQRLTAADYKYRDPVSQVTTQTLLALCWIAIHDEALLTGSLSEAKQRLVIGLYEAQREYNISKNGEDGFQNPDEPACPAGAFNKMVEQLASLHPDVTLVYKTKETASFKLPKIVRECAVAYLKQCVQTNTAEQTQALRASIEENGLIRAVWPFISEKVLQTMFSEFGSLFPEGIDSQEYNAFIATGVDTSDEGLDVSCLTVQPSSVSLSGNGQSFFQIEGTYTAINSTLNTLRLEREARMAVASMQAS